VGSLARTRAIIEGMKARRLGELQDPTALAENIRQGVTEVVRKQLEIGIDIPSDGEYGRYGFFSYIHERLGGLEPRELLPGESVWGDVNERRIFPDFFEQYDRHYRFLWMLPQVSIEELANAPGSYERFRVTGPIAYTGRDAIQGEIETFRSALDGLQFEDAFIPAVTPASRKTDLNVLDFYPSQQSYLYAVADAMREEYKAITDAGFIVQLDYAALNPNPQDQVLIETLNPTDADMTRARELGVEVVNHALQGIPEEQVRFHHCWGSHNQPHTQDIPLKSIASLLVKINAQAYSIEAANPRHEHEWMIWKDVKLPEGKILIPGFISIHTNVVEHPELVAWRIKNYASVVGRENLIAGVDCGFSQYWDTIRVHPSIQWAKLRALVDGAALATQELWA
jgi:5-methyltetrahydropteroyltriglutamate--homocysteine methyltransferase